MVCVVRAAVGYHLAHVRRSPSLEPIEQRHKREPQRRETVFHPKRRPSANSPGKIAISFQRTQHLAQHLVRNPAELATKLGKAQRASQQSGDRSHAPLGAQSIQHVARCDHRFMSVLHEQPIDHLIGETRSPRRVSPNVEEGASAACPIGHEVLRRETVLRKIYLRGEASFVASMSRSDASLRCRAPTFARLSRTVTLELPAPTKAADS